MSTVFLKAGESNLEGERGRGRDIVLHITFAFLADGVLSIYLGLGWVGCLLEILMHPGRGGGGNTFCDILAFIARSL